MAVYLRGTGEGELEEAASRGLAGPHARVADRLLDVALGPSRERTVLEVTDVVGDLRLAAVAAAARETGIGSALAVPLVALGEVVGLLAAYPEGRPAAGEHETALLAALAGQLAVAVRNAQLHEQATRLGEEREAALAAERAAARQIRALYEVSRSFAQSLRLDETLDALARTVVEVLDLDAAVVRMPDERREQLLPRAIHVRDAPFAAPVRTILSQPVPFGQHNVQRLFRDRRAFRLGPGRNRGEQFLPALVPFLEKGWTAAVVPVALPTEVVASLGVFSFRPGNPLSQETIEAATALATQAALAIDNARLYQQQKQFADTMQRSLLPRSRPVIEGLEVGEVYEPSARVDVGGDVYDFLALEDGRLAVVLGDVTGHGVDATADMAMAKFVFRSLAREHPEPADFLAAANDVICSEIGPGKFISMSYVVVDGAQRPGRRRERGSSRAADRPPGRVDAAARGARPRARDRRRPGVRGVLRRAPARCLARPLHRRGHRGAPGRRAVRRRPSRRTARGNGTSCRRARSRPRSRRTRANSQAATSPTTSRSSSFGRTEPPDPRRHTGRKLESGGPWPSAPASSSASSSAPSAWGRATPGPMPHRRLRR